MDKLKALWEGWQKVLDLHGDSWMGLFTTLILARIFLVLKGYSPLSMAEATAYSFAIGAFGYSKGGPKQS